jgi:DNA-directed RNA polymerase subunit F
MENEFEKIASDFLVPLRMGEGIDNNKYLALCDALHKLRDELSNDNKITKSLALLLIDIYPQMQGIASLYDDGEAEKIQDWAEDLIELIHEIVT